MPHDDGLVGGRIDHLDVVGGHDGRAGRSDLPPERVDLAGVGDDRRVTNRDGQVGHAGEVGTVVGSENAREVGGAVIAADNIGSG